MWKYFKQNKVLMILTLFFSCLVSIGTLGIAFIMQTLVDVAINGDNIFFRNMCVVTLFYFMCLGVFSFIHSLLTKKIKMNVESALRNDIYLSIMSLRHQQYFERDTGTHISRMNNDIKMVEENYIIPVFNLIENVVTFLGTLIAFLYISPEVTLSLLLGLCLMATLPNILANKLKNKQDNLSEVYGMFTNETKDIFEGYEVITSFDKKDIFYQEFKKCNNILAKSIFDRDKLLSINESLSRVLGTLTMVFVVIVSAYFVLIGNFSVGTLFALVQLSNTFVNPLMKIMECIPKIRSVENLLKKIKKIHIPNGDYNKKSSKAFREVSVNQLSFSYDDKRVINNISCLFERGKKYLIIGESGGGKTTLIRLLLGYYPEYLNHFMVDGKVINDSQKLSRLMSVVHQNTHIFNSTIIDNICLKGQKNAEKLEEALKISGLMEFVNLLPEGENTVVGESGKLLSGGQKQRISIARAIYQNAPILILDEGTAALDKKNSYEIESALVELKNITIISISHKINPKLIANYDEIINFKYGKICERGNFSTLMEKRGEFYHLFNDNYEVL